MPTAGPSPLASISGLTNLLIPAYDRAVEFQLREQPTFRASVVDRRPVNVTNPGDTVYFTFHSDLATTKTPLVETQTPDSIAPANPTRISVQLQEYGTWLPKTLKLQRVGFTQIDWEIAELLGRQQADTLDSIVRDVMDTSTNTLGAGATEATSASLVRRMRNKMRANLAPTADGANYIAHAHPDVTFDLMSESGQNVWASPHTYVDPTAIYAGEVGRYSAVRFIENTRCKVVAPTATVNSIYTTYVVGKQALVEAVSIEPHTVAGEVTDPLRRFIPIGWHGFLGWNLFRPQGLLRVQSTSSLYPKTT